jgi:hypothetical protein
MGQAKIRGSFESRKQSAIIRDQKERELQAKLREERERNKTPQQRKREQNAMMRLATILTLSGCYDYYPLNNFPMRLRSW